MTSTRLYLESLFGLSGKTALVTGGGHGIGLSMTRALASAGAKVFIASRKIEACKEAAESMRGLPGECIAMQANLQSEEGVNAFLGALRERTGTLNILVNNAGRTWGAPLATFPWKAWGDIMTLNVTAPFALIRDLAALLASAATKEDPSRVINIGSVMGTMPHGAPAYSYSASKAALHHLTRIFANELAAQNITVNAIAPGPFPSDMTAFFTRDERASARVLRGVPLGRFGTGEDLAGLVLLLCGSGGSYITGAIIPLDGGMTAYRSPGIEQGL